MKFEHRLHFPFGRLLSIGHDLAFTPNRVPSSPHGHNRKAHSPVPRDPAVIPSLLSEHSPYTTCRYGALLENPVGNIEVLMLTYTQMWMD